MRVFGIFAKHPRPGEVKTRLAASIGLKQAADLYEAFLGDIIDRFRSTTDRGILCYAPQDAAATKYFEALGGPDYELWRQPITDLGTRLSGFFDHVFHTGGDQAVVIGTDSPTLPRQWVEDAFTELRDHDCVLGPSTDGGYYLLGMRTRTWPIFEGVDWSSPHVLRQTLDRIEACCGAVGVLPPWYDVDTFQDLELLQSHLRALALSGRDSLPRTEAVLKQF